MWALNTKFSINLMTRRGGRGSHSPKGHWPRLSLISRNAMMAAIKSVKQPISRRMVFTTFTKLTAIILQRTESVNWVPKVVRTQFQIYRSQTRDLRRVTHPPPALGIFFAQWKYLHSIKSWAIFGIFFTSNKNVIMRGIFRPTEKKEFSLTLIKY